MKKVLVGFFVALLIFLRWYFGIPWLKILVGIVVLVLVVPLFILALTMIVYFVYQGMREKKTKTEKEAEEDTTTIFSGVWKFLALATVAVVIVIGGVYAWSLDWKLPAFKPSPIDSSVAYATKPTTTTTGPVILAYGVDAILREVVCKPETGCKHTYPDGPNKGKVQVHENADGSKDIGILQINDKVWGDEAKSLGLDLYKEEDNLAFGRILVTKLGYGPWARNFHKWGTEIGERISLVVYARPKEFGPEILCPPAGGLDTSGGGKHYRIRKRGEKGVIEVDVGTGLVNRGGEVGKIESIQLMSLEEGDVEVTLTFVPGPVTPLTVAKK